MAANLDLSLQHILEHIFIDSAGLGAATVIELDGYLNVRDRFGLGAAVPAAPRATVADASTAHALNSTFSDTEAEAALNALGVKINAILATLEAFGFHLTA